MLPCSRRLFSSFRFLEIPFTLLHNLEKFKLELDSQSDLGVILSGKSDLWQSDVKPDDLVACILGHHWEEVNREIDFALKGIPNAIEKNIRMAHALGKLHDTQPFGQKGSGLICLSWCVQFISRGWPRSFLSFPCPLRPAIADQ